MSEGKISKVRTVLYKRENIFNTSDIFHETWVTFKKKKIA